MTQTSGESFSFLIFFCILSDGIGQKFLFFFRSSCVKIMTQANSLSPSFLSAEKKETITEISHMLWLFFKNILPVLD